jgi:hypothetical protein
MRTFHVIAFTAVVEQIDDAPADQSAARTIVATAVRHACALATDLTGRQTSVRSIVVEPIRVMELEHEQEVTSE